MDKLVVASYNIRYARGPYLITGGLRRKMGLMSLTRRSEHVARQISAAARAFSDGGLLPRVDVLALQEADLCTQRSGGHHVAKELAEKLGRCIEQTGQRDRSTNNVEHRNRQPQLFETARA